MCSFYFESQSWFLILASSFSLPPLSIQNWVQIFLYSHLFSKARIVVCEDCIWVTFGCYRVFWDVSAKEHEEKEIKEFSQEMLNIHMFQVFWSHIKRNSHGQLIFYHKKTERKIQLNLRMKEKQGVICHILARPGTVLWHILYSWANNSSKNKNLGIAEVVLCHWEKTFLKKHNYIFRSYATLSSVI